MMLMEHFRRSEYFVFLYEIFKNDYCKTLCYYFIKCLQYDMR